MNVPRQLILDGKRDRRNARTEDTDAPGVCATLRRRGTRRRTAETERHRVEANPRHAVACTCHRRPIDRSSNGYTNARRNGLIAAMYVLPNHPFGFTSTAICAW